MMKYCAVVKDGLVENTIIVGDDWAFDGISLVEYDPETPVWIGGNYEGGVFSPPPKPEPEPEPDVSPTPSSGDVPVEVL